jgi:hypothetical protein
MAVERNNSAHDFETMLSLHLQRRQGRGAICENFDPERANAFVEGILASAEASRYEEHLSLCSTCRQAVTDLKRMALSTEPIGQVRPVSPEITTTGWFTNFVDSLRAAPLRWGVAAAGACAVVLAIMTFNATERPLRIASPEPAGTVSMASPAATPREESLNQQISRAVKSTQAESSPQAKKTESALALDSTARPAVPNQLELPKRQNEQQLMLVAGALPPTSPPALSSNVDAVAPASEPTAGALRYRSVSSRTESEQSAPVKGDQAVDRKSASKAAADFMPQPDALMKKLAKPTPTPNVEDENFRAMTRKVRDKTFRFENGKWIDQEFKREYLYQRKRFERGSPDYEKLITDMPELKVFFDLGPVLVVWQFVVYEVK